MKKEEGKSRKRSKLLFLDVLTIIFITNKGAMIV